jgi:uncharacterized membrane protein YsdA (DUF1294 family)
LRQSKTLAIVKPWKGSISVLPGEGKTLTIADGIGCYLFGISLAAFLVCGWDKFRACRSGWRVPEATLLLLAALGGSFGLLIGMRVFRHKTRKPKFYIGVPMILLAQVLAVGAVWYFFYY